MVHDTAPTYSVRFRTVDLRAFCISRPGTWRENIPLFFSQHPDLQGSDDQTESEVFADLAERLQREELARAAAEDENSPDRILLDLPGVPRCWLSPVIEVAPGDWRRWEDVSLQQQAAFSAQMRDYHLRQLKYLERKQVDGGCH